MTVTLVNLTIRNGSADAASANYGGGGIFNFGGSVTLNNVNVTGNNSGQDGGGINTSGMLTLYNSTITGNTAGRGGGIFNFGGTVTLNASTVSGNTATAKEYPGGAGGGIYTGSYVVSADGKGTAWSGGQVTLNNSPVTGNSPDDCAPRNGIACVGVVTN